ARDRAAHRDTGVEQRLVRRLRVLELLGVPVVVEDERVEVAVTRVKDVGDLHAVALGDRAERAHDLGEPGARHHAILKQVRRREAPHRARRLLASFPQERALALVARDSDVESAALAADRRHALRLCQDLGARAVQLDEEHRARVLRISGPRPLVDRPDHQLVEHLQGRWDDARGDDRRDRLGRFLDGPKGGEDRLDRLGRVEEPDRHRRHEAERPLRADGDARQVVARAVGDLPAEPHDLARARDQLEPQDVVSGDAVLETVRPAGVGRHVAADGRDHLARGIGREEPSPLLHRAREPEVDQPRLDRRRAVREVDLDDPGHPVQSDHHPAEGCHGAADQARARAARDDGHALAATEAHDRHDLGGALGQGDDVGRALVEGVHVAFVDESPFRGGDEAIRAEDPPELVEETGTWRHGITLPENDLAGSRRDAGKCGHTVGGGAQEMRQVSPEVRSFAMSPGPRSEIAFCSWSSMISSYTGPVTAASTPIGTGKSGAKRSARSFAAFTLVSSWTQSALAATSFALTTFGRTPSMMTARRSSCGPKSRGLPGSSRSSYWSFCSLSYITFHARSLYTLQFWRISTNAAPLWWAARFTISSMCAMLRSTVRATKVAPQPSANARGFTGRSAEPSGVDFVTLPSSLVGEY